MECLRELLCFRERHRTRLWGCCALAKREGRMTQPDGQEDNPTSAITLPPAHLDWQKNYAETYNENRTLAGQVEEYQSIAADRFIQDPIVALLASLRDEIGEQNFQHWFNTRTRFEVSGDRCIVYVANPFVLNWLHRRFRTALNRAAQFVLGLSASCQLEVDESLLVESPSTENSEIEGSEKSGASQNR